jgi:hypothetical protein
MQVGDVPDGENAKLFEFETYDRDNTTAYKDHKVVDIEDIAEIEITPAVFQGGNNVALGYPDRSGPAQSGAVFSIALKDIVEIGAEIENAGVVGEDPRVC